MERLTQHTPDNFGFAEFELNPRVYEQDAIDRLAAYEDTGLSPEEIPHWIPVGERLPKEIEYREADARELIPLLVCVEGTEYPFRAFYDGKSWGDGWSKLDVTFWMSLPQPPKEEK